MSSPIGDVAEGLMLAHKASHDGEIAAEVAGRGMGSDGARRNGQLEDPRSATPLHDLHACEAAVKDPAWDPAARPVPAPVAPVPRKPLPRR